MLTTALGWRWIFFVNLPIGVLALVITLLGRVPSPRSSTARPDVPGFVLFTGALGALIYGLIRTNNHGWGDSVVSGCFAAFVVLLIGFVAVETRSRHAMFDLALFTKPTFVGVDIAAFAVAASSYALLLYLHNAKHYSRWAPAYGC